MREIVLDTETTGLDQQNDKIIEIACIELKNCVQTGNIFQKYINPEKEISDDAVKIHGLTNSNNTRATAANPQWMLPRNILKSPKSTTSVLHSWHWLLFFKRNL